MKLSPSKMSNLSLLVELDEILRHVKLLFAEPCEQKFLEFVRNQEKCRVEWLHAVEQCERLQQLVDSYKIKLQDSEKKLCVARKLLEEEQMKRKAIEIETLQLEKQLELVRDVVFQGKGKLNDETKEKLAFLNNTSVRSRRSFGRCDPQRLNTISEAMDSTGSILSDLGYTQSEDELDTSLLCSSRPWKKFRTPKDEEGPSVKRVRHSGKKSVETAKVRASAGEHLIATTTVMVEQDGPITAYSKINTGPDVENKENVGMTHSISGGSGVRMESCQFPGTYSQRTSPHMSPVINYGQGISNKFNNRPHVFINRTMLTPDMCGVCGNKIKFAKMVVRCKECRITCHMQCKNQAPLPCIPVGNTPTRKGFIGTIADFTPPVPPMVPAIIVHCIQEIEQRGLVEVGIYRVSGSDRDVKALKEKFLRGKGVPNISVVDIHVVCGTVKDFLRSLKEPLVTHTLWLDFVRAAEIVDPEDSKAAMYQAISSLPQPNRDTLAFVVLHLQRVAEWPDCKMPVENLAKVFGPTIVGYSSSDVDGMALARETKKQVAVMQLLMGLPSEYWQRFTEVDPDVQIQLDLPRTPSSAYLTASSSNVCQRYFATTPVGTM